MILPGQHAQSKGCQSKTVSVLLCNYNHGIYLPESLGAICNQTRQPDEVVVIDDGSTDDSWSIIQQFASRYPFVFAIRNGINRGLMFSIARALRIASMDYVVWASADDLLLPGFIERSMEILESSDRAPIVFSQLSVFDDETGETKEFVGDAASGPAFDFGQSPQYLSPSDLERRLTRSYLWLSGNTAVVRRDLLIEGAGFRPELAWHADWFAFYAVALRHGVWLVPETLARMREQKERYSTIAQTDAKKQRRVLKALLKHLRSPDGIDLRPAFRRHPCLFSPMGKPMLQAARLSMRDWDIYLRILQWTLNHEGGIDVNVGAATGQERLQKRGHNRLRVSGLISRLTNFLFNHAG
jgi:glycosyltransferase involved in cell wall biosynthesis